MSALKQSLQLFLTIVSILAQPVYAADIEAGEQRAKPCIGCHGLTGKSANEQRPNLAAQQQEYFINQIYAYKRGIRDNPMMQSMSANLKDDEVDDLAAYFASLPPIRSGGEPHLAKAGQAKASICLTCHGTKGEGNGPVPRLAGQHPGYLERQLNYFKTGARRSEQMQHIVESLTEADIKELAAYFGSQ